MTLEYDGSEFHGWQVQPGLRTVQGVVSESLSTILREDVKLVGAGRTDAGVHAHGQVANFQSRTRMSAHSLREKLNSILPDDVYVRDTCYVPGHFHSRYDAVSKIYRYTVLEGRSPLRRRHAWEVKYALDIDRMNRSAGHLIGHQDLSSFTVEPKKNNAVNVLQARWTCERSHFHFEVEADRFLNKMVRMMVGRMVEIGRGRFEPESMSELARQKRKGAATPTAPAHGLCLLEVKY